MELFLRSLGPFVLLVISNASLVMSVVSLMSSTGTPYTTDSITSVLDRMIPWINFFIRGRMGTSLRHRRPPTVIYFAQATSLPTMHLCNLSILVKMTFLIKINITYFSHQFTLSRVISHSKSSSASWRLASQHLFCLFLSWWLKMIK